MNILCVSPCQHALVKMALALSSWVPSIFQLLNPATLLPSDGTIVNVNSSNTIAVMYNASNNATRVGVAPSYHDAYNPAGVPGSLGANMTIFYPVTDSETKAAIAWATYSGGVTSPASIVLVPVDPDYPNQPKPATWILENQTPFYVTLTMQFSDASTAVTVVPPWGTAPAQPNKLAPATAIPQSLGNNLIVFSVDSPATTQTTQELNFSNYPSYTWWTANGAKWTQSGWPMVSDSLFPFPGMVNPSANPLLLTTTASGGGNNVFWYDATQDYINSTCTFRFQNLGTYIPGTSSFSTLVYLTNLSSKPIAISPVTSTITLNDYKIAQTSLLPTPDNMTGAQKQVIQTGQTQQVLLAATGGSFELIGVYNLPPDSTELDHHQPTQVSVADQNNDLFVDSTIVVSNVFDYHDTTASGRITTYTYLGTKYINGFTVMPGFMNYPATVTQQYILEMFITDLPVFELQVNSGAPYFNPLLAYPAVAPPVKGSKALFAFPTQTVLTPWTIAPGNSVYFVNYDGAVTVSLWAKNPNPAASDSDTNFQYQFSDQDIADVTTFSFNIHDAFLEYNASCWSEISKTVPSAYFPSYNFTGNVPCQSSVTPFIPLSSPALTNQAVMASNPSLMGSVFRIVVDAVGQQATILETTSTQTGYLQNTCITPGFQDCRPIAGLPQTSCIGFFSSSVGEPCSSACGGRLFAGSIDNANDVIDPICLQTFATEYCNYDVSQPGATDPVLDADPACACIRRATSTVPFSILGTGSAPTTYKDYITKYGKYLPQSILDVSNCWWPPCRSGFSSALPDTYKEHECTANFVSCFAAVGQATADSTSAISVDIANACGSNEFYDSVIIPSTDASLPFGSTGSSANVAERDRSREILIYIAVGVLILVIIIAACIGVAATKKRAGIS